MTKQELKTTVANLINTPSFVDEKHDERAVIAFIEQYVKNNTKYKVEKQKVINERYNLIIKGGIAPKVVLFGHMDTVLPKSKNALKALEQNGRLYGLGSVDMKSGVAVALALLQEYSPDSGLCVVLTVDEEYFFKGAIKLIEKYKFNPEYIINLEPTGLKLRRGCRGVTEFDFEVIGKTAHAGSKHLGINAIEATTQIYDYLNSEISKINKETKTMSSLNIAHLHGGVLNNEGDIAYAGNVVPNFVKTTGEIRLATKILTEKHIREVLFKKAKDLGVKIKNLKFKFHLGSMLTAREDLILMEKALIKNKIKFDRNDDISSGYVEVQMLDERWRSKTIIFGPGPEEKCHTEDEYVTLSTLYKTYDVMKTFLDSAL